jgi:hypothetical protein
LLLDIHCCCRLQQLATRLLLWHPMRLLQLHLPLLPHTAASVAAGL